MPNRYNENMKYRTSCVECWVLSMLCVECRVSSVFPYSTIWAATIARGRIHLSVHMYILSPHSCTVQVIKGNHKLPNASLQLCSSVFRRTVFLIFVFCFCFGWTLNIEHVCAANLPCLIRALAGDNKKLKIKMKFYVDIVDTWNCNSYMRCVYEFRLAYTSFWKQLQLDINISNIKLCVRYCTYGSKSQVVFSMVRYYRLFLVL